MSWFGWLMLDLVVDHSLRAAAVMRLAVAILGLADLFIAR